MFENKNVKRIVGLLALAMIVPLAGCSKSIVGKWKDKSGMAIYTFAKDGTGTIEIQYPKETLEAMQAMAAEMKNHPEASKMAMPSLNPEPMKFTWKTEGDTLKMKLSLNAPGVNVEEGSVKYSISGNTLTLTSDKKTETLERVE
ncbi:MAG: hypothetical protein FWE88_04165 [Phycisphaerae bacterium]|nr:hypothetical protein [Phycisphaerae bacterium]